MYSISRDPIISVINNGIRRDINITIDNECYVAAIILIYCGIDTMASLSRPKSHECSTTQDFKSWVEKYFHVEGAIKITPDEWWEARNGMVHTYTPFSKKHKTHSIRLLLYTVEGYPHVAYNPKVNPNLVMVDILGMRDTFFSGINRFLIDSFVNPDKRQLMEERLSELVRKVPF